MITVSIVDISRSYNEHVVSMYHVYENLHEILLLSWNAAE